MCFSFKDFKEKTVPLPWCVPAARRCNRVTGTNLKALVEDAKAIYA